MATDVVASVRERVHAVLGVEASSLVVAVSGGPDSVSLLDAVVAVACVLPCQLVVGHVDHRLRPESAEDAAFVSQLAAGYGLRCEVRVVDVPALAQRQLLGIEEAARIARYRALAAIAHETHAASIVTGHTRSDAVETLLMHLMRGSGGRGLVGMRDGDYLDPALVDEPATLHDHDRYWVWRPLRQVDRDETVEYCHARGLEYRTDPTNADSRFLRNRIRQHLLPVLRTYNPSVDAALDRLGRATDDDERFLDAVVAERYRSLAEHDATGAATFDLHAWQRLWRSLQRRLILMIAAELGVRDVTSDAVERALGVGSDGPTRADVAGRLVIRRSRDKLIFQSAGRAPGRGDSR